MKQFEVVTSPFSQKKWNKNCIQNTFQSSEMG